MNINQITDLHRESVDHITIPSKQGKGDLKRVEEVRGVMTWPLLRLDVGIGWGWLWGMFFSAFASLQSNVGASLPRSFCVLARLFSLPPPPQFRLFVSPALLVLFLTRDVPYHVDLCSSNEKVFDCWFESGSMPYAQLHYPFENKEKFEQNFPADFIAEGLDQVCYLLSNYRWCRT